MSYKGAIKAGSRVTVTLALDPSSSAPASVMASFAASGGGGGQSQGTVVAPAAEDVLTLELDAKGMLQIFVDMAVESDTGTLTTGVDGAEKDRERIVGDTLWTYAVIP